MVNRRHFLGAMLTPAVAGAGGRPQPGPSPSVPPLPDHDDPDFWTRVRDQFYFPPGEAFFNTGTIGAVPRFVLERVVEDMRTLEATVTRWDYTANTPNWISGYSPEMALREKVGKLVNAEGRDIDRKSTRLNSSHIPLSRM